MEKEEIVMGNEMSTVNDVLPNNLDFSALFRPLNEAEIEEELDIAIAEFDAGHGFDAKRLCHSIREWIIQ